jgi:CRP-like cAMP-binding protein
LSVRAAGHRAAKFESRFSQGDVSPARPLTTRFARMPAEPQNPATAAPQTATGMGCARCAVRELGFCRTWLDQSQDAIAQSEKVIPARRLVFRAKDLLYNVPVICAGWSAVAAYLPNGRRQILSFPLPGEFVWPSLVFVDGPARDVEAVTPIRYRVFDRTAMREQIAARPKLLERLLRDCHEEKERLSELVVDLGRRRAEERVARLVLDLMTRLDQHGLKRGNTIDFPLRQTHVADALGLTTVYINEVLRDFRDKGIFEITGRSLTVLDPFKLSLVANR